MQRFIAFLFMSWFLALPHGAESQHQLTVTSKADDGALSSVDYTTEDLLSMETVTVTTSNDFVDSETMFVGPLLRDLFSTEALTSESAIKLTALNDYSTVIPGAEVLDYDVIVAVLADGKPMSIRDKGPYWIIYPMTQNPELRDPKYNDRLIWQLSHIELVRE